MRYRRLAGPALSLAAIFASLLVLGGVELGLRRFWPLSEQTEAADKYIRFLRENAGPFFYVEKDTGERAREIVQIPTVWMSSPAKRYLLEKPASVRRILVIGESSADRLGLEMSDVISASPALSDLEVMNCGSGSASLEMVENRYDEALRYAPDAVILAFGHALFTQHPALSPLQLEWLRFSRKSQLLRRLSVRSPVSLRPVQWPAEAAPERLEALNRFLGRLARDSRRLHIPVVVIALPSNLWFAPSSGAGERTDPEFLEIVYRHSTGHESEAVAALEALLSRKSSAWWHFTLGDWLYRRGERKRAYRQLVLAKDTDPVLSRTPTAVAAGIRESVSREGLLFLDGERGLKESRGIPGWESFADNVHARPGIYGVWAEQSLRLLAANGFPLHPGARITRPSRPFEFYSALTWALSMIDLGDPTVRTSLVYLAEQWLGRFLIETDPLSSVTDPPKASAVKLAFAEALWRSGRRARALAANQELRRSDPAWEEPYAQLAFFRLRTNEPALAREALLEALRLNPARADLMFFVSKLKTGNR